MELAEQRTHPLVPSLRTMGANQASPGVWQGAFCGPEPLPAPAATRGLRSAREMTRVTSPVLTRAYATMAGGIAISAREDIEVEPFRETNTSSATVMESTY